LSNNKKQKITKTKIEGIMTKMYLAGKISGEDYKNVKSKFNYYMGLYNNMVDYNKNKVELINPLEHINQNTEWTEAIKKCIEIIKDCDSILFIPDFVNSNGCKIEHYYSTMQNKKIYYTKAYKREIINKINAEGKLLFEKLGD